MLLYIDIISVTIYRYDRRISDTDVLCKLTRTRALAQKGCGVHVGQAVEEEERENPSAQFMRKAGGPADM